MNVESGSACTRELGPYSKLTSNRLYYLEYIPINPYIRYITVAVFLEYVVGLSCCMFSTLGFFMFKFMLAERESYNLTISL